MTTPNTPHDEKNPRDPEGGGGSQLNPLRDHVQGEPEGAGAQPTPPAHPTPPAQPPHHNDAAKKR